VKRVAARIGDWTPPQHECHANVHKWVEHSPKDRIVRGWLYFDFLGAFEWVKFTSHSVIETETGELIDITPSQASTTYPFIRHEGTDEEFTRLVERSDHGDIKHYRPAEQPWLRGVAEQVLREARSRGLKV